MRIWRGLDRGDESNRHQTGPGVSLGLSLRALCEREAWAMSELAWQRRCQLSAARMVPRPSLRPPGAGCRSGGGARRGSWRSDPAATREATSRGRPETAEPAAGPDVSAPLAWAPALDSAPVPLRAVLLRSGSSSARARLGLRWRPPRRARGRRRRAPWPAPRLWSWRSPSSSVRPRPRLRQVSARRSHQACPAESTGPWRSSEESVSSG